MEQWPILHKSIEKYCQVLSKRDDLQNPSWRYIGTMLYCTYPCTNKDWPSIVIGKINNATSTIPRPPKSQLIYLWIKTYCKKLMIWTSISLQRLRRHSLMSWKRQRPNVGPMTIKKRSENTMNLLKSMGVLAMNFGAFNGAVQRLQWSKNSKQSLIPRLQIKVTYKDQEFILMTPQISSIPKKLLKAPINAIKLSHQVK